MGGLRYVDNVATAMEMVTWLSERRPVLSLDTETTGLNVHDRGFAIRLLQIGDTDTAWVIPFQEWRGFVSEVLRKYDGTWAMWNAAYDMSALKAEGLNVRWDQVVDCMIACRLAEPNSSAGLKEAAVRHVAPSSKLSQTDLHTAMRLNGWGWDNVPIDFPPYVIYAAQDVILTSRLHQHPVIRAGMHSQVFDLEMQVLAICWLMSENGMRVDLDYARDEAIRLRERTVAISTYMAERYDGLSPGSPAQLGRWFMDQGATITEVTPGGAPSVSKKQLAALTLSGIEPVVDVATQVLAYRKADRIAGSYLEGFGKMADSEGLLHAQVNTLAARTGRMSIREPALQTLPKPGDDPMSRIVRRAIIPRNEDEVLVSADWSQIEARLAAHVSMDANLIDAFNVADSTGGDFFVEMGKLIYKDPNFTKKDDRRKTVKNVIYGLCYGAGAAKMAETGGIPEAEAAAARAEILGTFPGLAEALKRYERMGSTGSVTTYYGRELQIEEGKGYIGLNSYIQGTAADCLKRSIVHLAHAGLDQFMVVPVHDEVVCSVPAVDADEIEHILVETMHNYDFHVGIPAEGSGPMARWGDD